MGRELRWQHGRTLGFICPSDLNNYQTIMNIQEIDLRTDRINCTTRGRDEAMLRKVRNVETCFGGEMDCWGHGEERLLVTGKDEREWSAQGYAQSRHFPKAITWEMRGADSYEFLQPAAKTGVLEVSGLCCDRALSMLLYCWREGRHAALRQMAQTKDQLRHMGRDTSLFLECFCERWCSKYHLFRDK